MPNAGLMHGSATQVGATPRPQTVITTHNQYIQETTTRIRALNQTLRFVVDDLLGPTDHPDGRNPLNVAPVAINTTGFMNDLVEALGELERTVARLS